MSSNLPPARRRRIAGERRRSEENDAASTTAVDLEKPPTPSGAGAGEPYTPAATHAGEEPAKARRFARRLKPAREVKPASRSLLVVVTVLLVAVLTLTALAASGVLNNLGFAGISRINQADAEAAAGRQASASAERAAEAILSYNYETLDSDVERATQFMTPGYEKQYRETFETLREPATTTQAVVQATVRFAGVTRAGADNAKVILFVDQTSTTTNTEDPKVALNRVQFLMVQDDNGSWLVDNVSSF